MSDAIAMYLNETGSTHQHNHLQRRCRIFTVGTLAPHESVGKAK
jgi:hypothetical protein